MVLEFSPNSPALRGSTSMRGDLRIEELTAQRFEAFERAFLIRPHQPRIPRDISGEDRRETAGLVQAPSPAASRRPCK